jgi:hypothetical protein
MRKLLTISTLGLAGVVGAGVMALPGSTIAADRGSDEGFAKREDNVAELALVSDDDDDDTNDDTGTGTRTRSRTGNSRSTNDGTRSNFTKVSRDRDLSRSDKTKDWTRDGGSRTRDWTANKTNDRSRNDSRGHR